MFVVFPMISPSHTFPGRLADLMEHRYSPVCLDLKLFVDTIGPDGDSRLSQSAGFEAGVGAAWHPGVQ